MVSAIITTKLENVAIVNALQLEVVRATPALFRLRRHAKFEVAL